MERYTVGQIRSSFNSAADDMSFILRKIIRPLSFYVTYSALKLGSDTPNKATMLSLTLGIVGMAFFIMGYFGMGAVFYILYLLFDCVDGNIARIKNLATYYGKFLDGIVDILIGTLLPLSVAMGVYFFFDSLAALVSGIVVAIAFLYSEYLLAKASFFYRWVAMEEGNNKNKEGVFSRSKELNPITSTSKLPLNAIYNIATDIKIITLLTAAIAGMSKVLFLIFLLSIAAGTIAVIIMVLPNAAARLNIPRISKLAASHSGTLEGKDK